jgi:predicted nucleotidyltransferase component of viral defense system
MAINEQYRRQVALLVRTLPIVAQERCFALKGGTAINLFVRDMPRLSVDIDLTYLPQSTRAESAADINQSMARIAESIVSKIPGASCDRKLNDEGLLTDLWVRVAGANIKVELNPVIRGCVYEPELRSTSANVQRDFGFAEIQVVSWADLYAGKIMAALHRQHPRDLFDVKDLLAKEGVNAQLRAAFVVYLLSHHRPMHEVLNPTRKDISGEFVQSFAGMTSEPVLLDELLEAREKLVEEIVGRMPASHREFLLSFEKGEPDWGKLDVAHARKLPAVLWRMQNLAKANAGRRTDLVRMLAKALES